MISSSFAFITHLRLRAGLIAIEHSLLSLAQMKNLGVLEILQPVSSLEQLSGFPRISDRTIREWALGDQPFPLLRILRIWGSHFTSTQSLQYLDKFPALAVYDVAGLRSDWPKEVLGNPPRGWTAMRALAKSRDWYEFQDHFLSMFQPGQKLSDWRPDMTKRGLSKALTLATASDFTRLPPSSWQEGNWTSAHAGWGSLLTYAHIGQVLRDQDLAGQRVKMDEPQKVQVEDETFTMPPVPLALITMGSAHDAESGDLVRRQEGNTFFETRSVLVRSPDDFARDAANRPQRKKRRDRDSREDKGRRKAMKLRKKLLPIQDLY